MARPLDTGLGPDICVAVRMDRSNRDTLDYYLLPRLDIIAPNVRFAEYNRGHSPSNRKASFAFDLAQSFQSIGRTEVCTQFISASRYQQLYARPRDADESGKPRRAQYSPLSVFLESVLLKDPPQNLCSTASTPGLWAAAAQDEYWTYSARDNFLIRLTKYKTI
jgi:hypothetical protein